jgi:predicted DNA-binding transcriptional regulator YafY
MFTQDEAGAMVMAGKLVDSFTDPSIKKAFQSSLLKVKAVLQQSEKNHVADLEDHIEVLPPLATQPITGKFLNEIRNAIVSRKVISLLYTSQYQQETTQREVEPIGLFYYSMSWHLIAWCRLRKGMRDFRTDRIVNLTVKEEQFTPGDIVTLQDYFNSIRENHADMQQVVVVFDRKTAAYVTNSRYYFGFVREEYTDEGIRMYFLVGQLPGMARWLLAYADAIEIEEPLSLKETMRNIVQELVQIYLPEVFHSKE